MAHYNKGILGAFNGKVGQVVGANWRGMDVLRSLPKKSKKAATEAQQIVREKFKLVMQFLSPIKTNFDTYFGKPMRFKSRFNLAVSYHIQEAITGSLGNFEIDYSKVLMTKGELLGVGNLVCTPSSNQAMDLSFDGMNGQGNGKDDDRVYYVACNIDKKVYQMGLLPDTRISGSATIQLPATWMGDEVAIFVTMVDANNRQCSTSIFADIHVVM